MKTDEFFMSQALEEAKKAYDKDEVPIGAVIVKDGQIVGRGHNTVEKEDFAIAHAEINAIKEASQKLGWRLIDCTMYVSLEPCAMCAGAIIQSRIKRLVVGLKDEKRGFAGSIYELMEEGNFNHKVEVERGILEDKSLELLQDFFKEKRRK